MMSTTKTTAVQTPTLFLLLVKNTISMTVVEWMKKTVNNISSGCTHKPKEDTDRTRGSLSDVHEDSSENTLETKVKEKEKANDRDAL